MTGRPPDDPALAGVQLHRLILFVAGDEPNSVRARTNVERICETHLKDQCELRIVDVLTDFRAAMEHRILVTPSLVMLEPAPRVQIAGTMHDTRKLLAALRLPTDDAP